MTNIKMHENEFDIDELMVRKLLQTQFKQWADLPLKLVKSDGTDHLIFRLGDDKCIRLPRVPGAEAQIEKEQRWLPFLVPHLPLEIPFPIGKGQPQDNYPSYWSIYHWVEGNNAVNMVNFDLTQAAIDLAKFINALHSVDSTSGPSTYRGLPLITRNEEVQKAIAELDGIVNTKAALKTWDICKQAPIWDKPPAWIHSDLLPANILVNNGRITGIIDFGMMGVGDPACDYLKQTPADLFIETDVIKVIQKNVPNSLTPTILLENCDLSSFLMNSCGDYSLRTKFKGTINPDLLISGLNHYFKILRSFEQNLDALEEIGVPDWRLNQVPQLYAEFLAKKALLLDEGLTHDELDKLIRIVPTIKSICEILAAQQVKETLVNCDFNENNLIRNEKTQQISIIDWGESVITHPFFSIASHLQSIARRYKLELNGPFLKKIKQQCLSCWLDVANMNEIDIIYQNILRLHPIFCSLAIHRLQAATGNKSKEMQKWFIAGFLKTLVTTR